jgi:Mn2+/Fe2+ NRAMP family transporter
VVEAAFPTILFRLFFRFPHSEFRAMSQGSPNPAAAAAIGSKATTALICSILCYFLCCPILSIVGLIFASQAQNMIQQSGVGQEHAGKATIAKVLSIVHLSLTAISVLVQIGMLAIGGFTQAG